MKVAIIGAGNGGQTMAGHLALQGHETWIYDIDRKKIEGIKQLGRIQLTNALEGFGKVKASLKMEDVVKDAEVIMIVTTATAHKNVAEELLNIVQDGQVILIIPGYWGSIEFKNICIKKNIKKDIIIGEAEILPYATRIIEIGKVDVRGVKKEVSIAALPASDTTKLFKKIKKLYPTIKTYNSVLEVTLNNVNPVFHPTIAIFNAGRIEAKGEFFFYPDGVMPRIAKFIQKIDDERLKIGKSLGLNLLTSQELLKKYYGIDRDSIYDGIQSNPAYKTGKAPNSLENSRYIYEDYPYGLVPLSELGKYAGVDTPHINNLIDITSLFIEKDLRSMGLTLEKLGLNNMSVDKIKEYCYYA